jgi:GGDEF domain-containing protein
MQAADAAMYRAKRAGRRHCVLAETASGKAGRRAGMAAVAGAPVFS